MAHGAEVDVVRLVVQLPVAVVAVVDARGQARVLADLELHADHDVRHDGVEDLRGKETWLFTLSMTSTS